MRTAAPLYYRWAFDPFTGQVNLGHNEDGLPSEIEYHQDLAPGPKSVHGYAYPIGGGWRLTDWEHKPVADPYVFASVMRSLKSQAFQS